MVSNVGTWMQTVGGTWLMTTLTVDTLPVALMQTATTLPALLVGLPAGSLADRVDRRRLLLATQAWMLVCATLLAILTVLGAVSPWLLLAVTFALGIGSVINGPTWSAILPEVVSRPQVPTAIIMNSAGFNISRATGPAIGGVVVAAFGPAATFMVNAVSFLATLTVIFRWRPAGGRSEKKPSTNEPFARTILIGIQYAWRERAQRIVLARSSIWMLCASSFWGLLPLVARRQMELEATGYGLLVTCFGAGAVLGSFVLPRLRRRWPTNYLLMAAIVTFALMLLVLAWVRFLPLVCVVLGLGGWAWTSSNQNFQIAVQMRAPRWLQARAIAAYLLTFQGGLAIGSAVWGGVAERTGNPIALTLAAAGLALGLGAAVRWPVEDQPV
ncbi:MAG: MFS transporter [Chloroflexota bacterium]|nr:MFS transporter [Chloroflexota bacterium]